VEETKIETPASETHEEASAPEAESASEVQEESVPEIEVNPNFKWYILRAHSGYEGRVEKTIHEMLKIEKLEHLMGEIFIPAEEVTRTTGGKKRKVKQKYFPGYILIHMDLRPELWHLLMGVQRVTGFIGGTREEPMALPPEELRQIKQHIDEGLQQSSVEEIFVLGQKVMITEGPFVNFSGNIDEINNEKNKLKILVSIFGRPTPVEVEFDQVEDAS